MSASSYVEKENQSEIIDIDALNLKLESIVSRENELRIEIQKIIGVIDDDQ